MQRLRRQHVLYGCRPYNKYLSGLYIELAVSNRIDDLRLQSGVHGNRRRDVHGVCGGELQDSDGLGRMHRLRRQHTVCRRRIDSTHQLRVQSGVLGPRRRDVHGVRGGDAQRHSRFRRLHALRGQLVQHIRGGSVGGGVRGLPGKLKFSPRECWHRVVLLQRRIPAVARPRRVYSVQSWLLRQRSKSVRVLPVRGGALLRGLRRHRQRNVPAVLRWPFFGCGECGLRFMPWKLEFTSTVGFHHRLHLQPRGNRVRRGNVRVVHGGEVQDSDGLGRVRRLQRRQVFRVHGSHILHRLRRRKVWRFVKRCSFWAEWFKRQHCHVQIGRVDSSRLHSV